MPILRWYGAVVDQNLAAGHVLEPGEHHQAGGFAGAGGAEQGDEFALGHVQIKVFDYPMLVVVRLLNVGELQERFVPSQVSHTLPHIVQNESAACGPASTAYWADLVSDGGGISLLHSAKAICRRILRGDLGLTGCSAFTGASR